MELKTLVATASAAVLLFTGCAGGQQQDAGTSTGAGVASGVTAGATTSLPDTLGVADFVALTQTDTVVVLDVRTPEEFAAGHLPNAINVDVNSADFATRLADLDPLVPYAIYCRSGNRSQAALNQMRTAGFADVHHLAGGIGAWQAAGRPVVK